MVLNEGQSLLRGSFSWVTEKQCERNSYREGLSLGGCFLGGPVGLRVVCLS